MTLPAGCKSFQDENDLRAFLKEYAERGQAALKVWQRDLNRGQFAFRIVLQSTREPWPQFWEILTRPNLDDDGRVVTAPSSTRTVLAFSSLSETTFEEISVNCGDCWGVIPKALFEQARALGWALPPALREHFDFVFRSHKFSAPAPLVDDRIERAKKAREDFQRRQAAGQLDIPPKPKAAVVATGPAVALVDDTVADDSGRAFKIVATDGTRTYQAGTWFADRPSDAIELARAAFAGSPLGAAMVDLLIFQVAQDGEPS